MLKNKIALNLIEWWIIKNTLVSKRFTPLLINTYFNGPFGFFKHESETENQKKKRKTETAILGGVCFLSCWMLNSEYYVEQDLEKCAWFYLALNVELIKFYNLNLIIVIQMNTKRMKKASLE